MRAYDDSAEMNRNGENGKAGPVRAGDPAVTTASVGPGRDECPPGDASAREPPGPADSHLSVLYSPFAFFD